MKFTEQKLCRVVSSVYSAHCLLSSPLIASVVSRCGGKVNGFLPLLLLRGPTYLPQSLYRDGVSPTCWRKKALILTHFKWGLVSSCSTLFLFVCLFAWFGGFCCCFSFWRQDLPIQAQGGLELTSLLPQLPALPLNHRPALPYPSETVMAVFDFEMEFHVALVNLELSIYYIGGLELLIPLLGPW